MPINRTASPTRGWCVRSSRAASRRGTATAFAVLAIVGCSSNERALCSSSPRIGSVQVARVAPEVEEGGVAFDLLGDGAGPGVLMCRDTLYADANALMALMKERDSVFEREGKAVIGTRPTQIKAYRHEGILYVGVAALAKDRRALVLQRGEQRADAIVWPQPALKHLKASGLTEGEAYKSAAKEGLIQ